MSSPTPLAPARRIITGHNAEGQAEIQIEENIEAKVYPLATMHPVWGTNTFPANLLAEGEGSTLAGGKIVQPAGSNIFFVDFPPGEREANAMHFTQSIDYVVVVKGEMDMVLPSGSVTKIKEGDVIVQRGTLHQWHNISQQWCRILVVTIGAEEVVVGGKKIDGFHKL